MRNNRSLRSRQHVGMDDGGASRYLAGLAARKAAFIDMHNADQDPPIDIDDVGDDDVDVQLDTLDFMQQMGERLDA